MDDEQKFNEAVEKIVRNDPRFDKAAYAFTNEALAFTVKKLNRSGNPRGMRHVSGQDLVLGFCEYAIQQFGPLAPDVLEFWGVHSGADVGCIVYSLIAEKILSASKEDSQSDFDCHPDLCRDLRIMIDNAIRAPEPCDPPVID